MLAQVGDVDEARRAIRLREEITKQGEARYLELAPPLFSALVATLPPREDRDLEAPLFSGLTDANLWMAITRACKAGGVPHFSPHALRRRRGCLHYKRTGSLAEVAEILGDTKRVAADHYVYALTDYREIDRRPALARLVGDLLHLHHLTPANEAALRSFPAVPVLGQLHGTELAMLRAIEAGPPLGWEHALTWAARFRRWAQACARLIVPPGSEREVGSLLNVASDRIVGLPSGVDIDLFRPRPLPASDRFSFWCDWLVEHPQGWDETGRPGSVRYRRRELWPFAQAETIFVFVGRFTAVKRLPLLLAAHKLAQQRFRAPAPLVLVGGHPGEWEGEHPHALIRELGNEQAFLAGWHDHEQLPEALNAADLLVLPSVAEAFGLVLVEAMACGLPVIAANAHGPAEIVKPDTGWLIPPDDETALTDALVAAANDPGEHRRRGSHASGHARRHYSWPRITQRVAHTYAQALADSQPPAPRRDSVSRGRVTPRTEEG